MTDNKKSPEKSETKPVETAKPAPTVKGKKAVGVLGKYRSRTKDAKLMAKADEIHDTFMAVKPGPIATKPSGGWLSYISGKTRFGALEVRKAIVKVHSLAFNDGKTSCEIIKVTAEDKVPVAKIKKRAEAYITAKTKKTESKD